MAISSEQNAHREESIGFIVHPTWSMHGGSPEIHLFGRLHSGETFLVIDTQSNPGFYVRASEMQRAQEATSHLGYQFIPTSFRTIDGEETARLIVNSPRSLSRARRTLTEAQLRTYEADVPFAWSYLIDRHLRGAVVIQGSWTRGQHVDRIYRNPTITSSNHEPQLVTASLAVHQDPQTGAIRTAALASSGSSTRQEERLYLAVEGHAVAGNATTVPTERELLIAFRAAICSLDPDLITGWDVIAKILVPLKERMEFYGVPFNLGRSDRLSRAVPSSGTGRWRGGLQGIIEGRQILDAHMISRSGQKRHEDYDLATIAQDVLGQTPSSVDECAHAVLGILDADDLIRLTTRRSLLIGIPLQRAWTSVQAFDFLYLSELHARGLVAPTRDVDRRGGAPAPGGLILSPRAGCARNVLVLDFKSLYPSIIRTFNIDPATQIANPDDGQDVILAPNGAAFTRAPGILPAILDRFFESRSQARSQGDHVASYAYKIIMNSFYGVLGTRSCRFASQSLSGAITSFGQHLLRWARDLLQDEGMDVIYGDTDSLFVDAHLPSDITPEAATMQGQAVAARVNASLKDYVASTYGVASRLELEMEKVYSRFFLPTVRGEERGRAKGYAGLVVSTHGDHVDVVGMEAVRRDWTPLARRFQRELLDLAFHDASSEDLEAHVLQTLRQLRSGRLDHELVYRKSLRRPLAEYTKTQPPHVQAARLLREERAPGETIRYVITVRGPRPLEKIDAPLDYTHIVRKQLKPIAESLSALRPLPEHLFGNGQIGLF